MTKVQLNCGQSKVLEAALKGENIFITGDAGTGKSFVTKAIITELNKIGKPTLTLAPTGIAAQEIGGNTIHTGLGMRIGAFTPHDRVPYKPERAKEIRRMEVLIIDEISMVRSDILDMAHQVLQGYKSNYTQPFGGMQLIFVGDVLQLPPVVTNNHWCNERQLFRNFTAKAPYKSQWFCHAPIMEEVKIKIMYLTKIERLDEGQHELNTLLNKIRRGRIKYTEIEAFNENRRITPNKAIKDNYIAIFTKNDPADTFNRDAMDKIQQPEYIASASLSGSANEMSDKELVLKKELKLKKSAAIMIVYNHKTSCGTFLKNGNKGIITDIIEDEETGDVKGITADIENVGEVTINSITKEIKEQRIAEEEVREYIKSPDEVENKDEIEQDMENGLLYVKRKVKTTELKTTGFITQLPIKIAFATTVHKAQGTTIQGKVALRLTPFSVKHYNFYRQEMPPNLIYVAISRATKLENIKLLGIGNAGSEKIDIKYIKRDLIPITWMHEQRKNNNLILLK